MNISSTMKNHGIVYNYNPQQARFGGHYLTKFKEFEMESIKDGIGFAKKQTKKCLALIENLPYNYRCSRAVKKELSAMANKKGYKLVRNNESNATIWCCMPMLETSYGTAKSNIRIQLIPVLSVGKEK